MNADQGPTGEVTRMLPPDESPVPETTALVTIERRIDTADPAELARVHQRAFEGYFLAQLGQGFLELLYRGFAESPDTLVAIARDGARRIVGAAIGTTRPERFFGTLLRRRWAGFARASAGYAIAHPRAIGPLARAVFYRGDKPAAMPDGWALFSSLCVEPETAGRGIGSALMRDWLAQLASAGAAGAYLFTDTDNQPANALYRRTGWQLDGVPLPGERSRYVYRLQ